MKLITAAMLAITFMILGACATPKSEVSEPSVVIPDAWRSRSKAAADLPEPAPDWWRAFGSPELEQLIAQTQSGSFDIAMAIAGVRQARLLAEMSGAALMPEVSGAAAISRSAPASGSLQASYELDFWGRNRAIRDGALAELRASKLDRATVGLMAISSVASVYVQLSWLREQHGVLHENIDLAKQILKIIESRQRAGAATLLDVSQQRGFIIALQRSVIAVRQQERDTLSTLAVLLGRPPQGFAVNADELDALRWPVADAGLPSQLLTRRPDIASLEAQLEAADANIAATRAAVFPTVTLGAGAAGESNLYEALDHPVYSLTAGLVAPIFNRRRLAAGHELAKARKDALVAAYRAAVVAAFADVEIALNGIASLDRQRQYHAQEERLAGEALRLVQSRYRAGAETLLVVLDAQRTFYSARETSLRLHRDRLLASIDLFEALGGGWSVAGDSTTALP